MKRYIIYTFLFVAPFIITLYGIEFFLSELPNAYMSKANYLKDNSKNVQVLVLGSSHGVTGIDPNSFSKNTFNIANYAQTLDLDYEILNKYQDELGALEYVIVPLSYHSLWSKLKYHPQTWRLKYYDIYYNISTEKNPLKRLLFLDHTMQNDIEILWDYYYKQKNPIADLTLLGLNYLAPTESLDALTKNSKEIADSHKAGNLGTLYNENIECLKKIIEIGKRKNAKIIFVTLPAHPSFIELLDEEQLNMLYATAKDLEDNKNVFYYNLLCDFSNTNENDNIDLFYDADHLSGKGAGVIGHKLDSIIKSIDNRVQYD